MSPRRGGTVEESGSCWCVKSRSGWRSPVSQSCCTPTRPNPTHQQSTAGGFAVTTPEGLQQIMAIYGRALDVGDDPIADLRRLRDLCENAPDKDHLLVLAV